MVLCEFEDALLPLVENYRLTQEDLAYTGHPLEAVLARKDCPYKHLIMAVADGRMVSFFVLDEGPDVQHYREGEGALLLRCMSTDSREMGKGYGKMALDLLPAFVREEYPGTEKVVLAVNEKNERAQKLYLKAGFRDTGLRRQGKKGGLMIMEQSVETI